MAIKLSSAKDRWVGFDYKSDKDHRSAFRYTQIALRFFCERRMAQCIKQIKLKSSSRDEGFTPRDIKGSRVNIRFWSFIAMYWLAGTKNMEINLSIEKGN